MSIALSLLQFPGQFFDLDGVPLASGLIYSYVAGTSTPLATYEDVNGDSANTNPIVLDTSGFATIFLLPTLYDLFVCPAADPVPLTPTAELYSRLGVGNPGQIFAASYGNVQAEGAKGVTLPYAILSSDNSVTIALASGAGAIQFPAATTRSSTAGGNGLPLKIYNFSANAATLTAAGADLINGNATLTLAAGKVADCDSDGDSTWLVSIGSTT